MTFWLFPSTDSKRSGRLKQSLWRCRQEHWSELDVLSHRHRRHRSMRHVHWNEQVHWSTLTTGCSRATLDDQCSCCGGRERKEGRPSLRSVYNCPFKASLCRITVDTVCCSRGLLLLYEMWFCKVKGNTVHVGLANMAERGGINVGLYVAQGSRRIMSANDTLSCSHYAVWLAGTTSPLWHIVSVVLICMYFNICLFISFVSVPSVYAGTV